MDTDKLARIKELAERAKDEPGGLSDIQLMNALTPNTVLEMVEEIERLHEQVDIFRNTTEIDKLECPAAHMLKVQIVDAKKNLVRAKREIERLEKEVDRLSAGLYDNCHGGG